MGDDRPAGEATVDADGPAADSAEASTLAPETECTVALPDELAADLEEFCRSRYVHRDEAIRSLLADWLDGRSAE